MSSKDRITQKELIIKSAIYVAVIYLMFPTLSFFINVFGAFYAAICLGLWLSFSLQLRPTNLVYTFLLSAVLFSVEFYTNIAGWFPAHTVFTLNAMPKGIEFFKYLFKVPFYITLIILLELIIRLFQLILDRPDSFYTRKSYCLYYNVIFWMALFNWVLWADQNHVYMNINDMWGFLTLSALMSGYMTILYFEKSISMLTVIFGIAAVVWFLSFSVFAPISENDLWYQQRWSIELILIVILCWKGGKRRETAEPTDPDT
ncbi:hypothetical protein KCM76_08585 [Zooshikella marina]|uniref:hypothetical protein n=1 Tax=Zooshikella ganghwensis TaxID=202772 RepID=UPI001BAEB029|nr:hypothetical protein [Zooshikella ganghwensis]MBU2706038.1 hypothetical protein [Zooshikella ganghwensis]